MLDGSSKYIDLKVLKQKLVDKDYANIEAKELIDKQKLLSDLKSGNIL